MKKPLTVKSIQALKPRQGEVPVGKVEGLYLLVGARGPRSWVLRYRRPSSKKPAKLTMGRVDLTGGGTQSDAKIGDPLTLAQARAYAVTLQAEIQAGRDPGSDHIAAKRNTWGDVVSRYYDDLRVRKLRNRHGSRKIVEKDTHAWWHRPIKTITRADVREAIDNATKRAPTAGSNLKTALGPIFSWAVERELVDVNIAHQVKRPMPMQARDRVLDDDELRCVWQAADFRGKALILTGQRLGEVSAIRAQDLVLEGDAPTWTIPAEVAKNGVEHRVALTRPAADVLRDAMTDPEGATIFHPTTKRWRNRWRARADVLWQAEHGAPMQYWRPHDLRRTFSSTMARLGVDLHITELVLNHRAASISGVARIYNRYSFEDEQRRALERWADHVVDIVEGQKSNIVKLNA